MTALAKARFARIVLPRLDEGYRLAHWLTGSPTDAEDVMQEASLRAYRAIESLVESNARAWFLTIVRNTSYSWLERHRPSKLTSIEDLSEDTRWEIENGASAAATETPEDILIAKHQATALQQAIEMLPVHLKETLILREYHGLSYREIAEVSAIPIGTVMSRLAKARQTLAMVVREERP